MAIPSGLIHNLAADDEDALAQIRRYLSFMPSSAWSYAPDRPTDDSGPRQTPELLEIVPRNNRQVYDMHRAIDVIVDDGQWFEVQPGYGQAIICGLAHLGGEPVAIIANQPMVLAGSVDTAAANKGAHFLTVADSFHLPIVLLADNPGVLPGTQSEKAGILRAGGKMFAAVTLATTIKVHVTFRKAYGFGSMVMGMSSFGGHSAAFAFPGATLGAMGASAPRQGGQGRRRADGRPAQRRAAGLLQLGVVARLRRADRSARDAKRAARRPRHGAAPAPGGAGAGEPGRHHALTKTPGEGSGAWASVRCYSCTSSISVPKLPFGWMKATVVPRLPGRGALSIGVAPAATIDSSAAAASSTR